MPFSNAMIKTRKIRLTFFLLFFLSWILLPLAFAQDTYYWTVDEGDELVFEIEGKEGEITVLLGDVTLVIEEITNEQIEYSLTPAYSVDTGSYEDFMQDSGTFNSSNGFITNNNTDRYSVDLVYSQEKFSYKEDEWIVFVAGYFEQFWSEFGSNDTYEWECTSNKHGYKVWFNDRSISEISYFQALYNSDGLLENFAGGIIRDGVEDYVKITRKGTSLFGFYIAGFNLPLLGVFGLISMGATVWYISNKSPKKEN